MAGEGQPPVPGPAGGAARPAGRAMALPGQRCPPSLPGRTDRCRHGQRRSARSPTAVPGRTEKEEEVTAQGCRGRLFSFLSWLTLEHVVVVTSHSAGRRNYLMELEALSK